MLANIVISKLEIIISAIFGEAATPIIVTAVLFIAVSAVMFIALDQNGED